MCNSEHETWCRNRIIKLYKNVVLLLVNPTAECKKMMLHLALSACVLLVYSGFKESSQTVYSQNYNI